MKTLIAALITACAAQAQNCMIPNPSGAQLALIKQKLGEAPTEREIGELLDKAEEKIAQYERTKKAVSPHLGADSEDPGPAQMRTVIDAMRKNKPTGYGMVMLMGGLDDMTTNATNDIATLTREMLTAAAAGKEQTGNEMLTEMAMVAAAKTGLVDISQLLTHATLRLIDMEETTLGTKGVPMEKK